METLIDNNFLNGTIKIVSKPECNLTIGRFEVYDEMSDELLDFNAYTTCGTDDVFDKNVGIQIIKLKLAREYYKYQVRLYKTILAKVNRTTKSAQDSLKHVTDKLTHINYELKKFQ